VGKHWRLADAVIKPQTKAQLGELLRQKIGRRRHNTFVDATQWRTFVQLAEDLLEFAPRCGADGTAGSAKDYVTKTILGGYEFDWKEAIRDINFEAMPFLEGCLISLTQVALTGCADGSEVDMRGRQHHLSERQMDLVNFARSNLQSMKKTEMILSQGMRPLAAWELDAPPYEFYGTFGTVDIQRNMHTAVTIMRQVGDPHRVTCAAHFDETYVWQREDPCKVGDEVKMVGYCFSEDKSMDKTICTINDEGGELARLLFVATLKTTDWWDVTLLTQLPVSYKFSCKKFVTKFCWGLCEAGYNDATIHLVVVGADCTSTFTEFAQQTVGIKPLPIEMSEFVKRRVKILEPITEFCEEKSCVIKHKAGIPTTYDMEK
jgi:hypothetical protein